jgi:glucuronokinase
VVVLTDVLLSGCDLSQNMSCREMFGDAALGETNLAMIATARSVGAAAKFTGSGGAIVAFCPAGEQQEQRLQGEACCSRFCSLHILSLLLVTTS